MLKKSKRRNGIRFFIVLIFICIIISILLFGTPIWYVKSIDIQGNKYYTQEEILAQVGGANGMHILQFNKKRAIKQLIELPYIETVEINIIYPASVQINIAERKAIGYVPFAGTYLCIDKKGQVVDQKEFEIEDNLPIVEGLKFNRFVLGEILETDNEDGILAVIEMTALMEKYNLLDKTVKIDVSNPSEIHLYINTLDVIIGEMKGFDKKIQWLSKILDGQYKMGVLDLSNIHKNQAIMSPVM